MLLLLLLVTNDYQRTSPKGLLRVLRVPPLGGAQRRKQEGKGMSSDAGGSIELDVPSFDDDAGYTEYLVVTRDARTGSATARPATGTRTCCTVGSLGFSSPVGGPLRFLRPWDQDAADAGLRGDAPRPAPWHDRRVAALAARPLCASVDIRVHRITTTRDPRVSTAERGSRLAPPASMMLALRAWARRRTHRRRAGPFRR